METSSKTCVAVDTEQATLFVALELSQATWLVGLHSPIADKISINRIDGGDTDKLCLSGFYPHPQDVGCFQEPE
jgi:hypothetical protein